MISAPSKPLKLKLACPDARERAGPVETQAQRARARRDKKLARHIL